LLLAHGPSPQPSLSAALSAWTFEPVTLLLLAAGLGLYLAGARRVRRWPAQRSALFAAGCGTAVIALLGPPRAYAHALFSVHMLQHLMLTMIAAPLLVLGAPVSLAGRAMSRRARSLTAFVHSRPARLVTAPVVAWATFALVTWLTHFSPLYDLALHDDLVHAAEHLLYIGAALLFWWPVAGLDPGAAGRLSPPARVVYLFAALPQQSFLGLALYSAGDVLYSHYATLARPWGPSPLDDQRLAGAIMWVIGDGLLFLSLALVAGAWMRRDQRDARRVDRRLGLG
jgi:cytochrome c oxidase assembly factor CtaG